MKKLLSLLAVMLIAISADAQAPFTYYRPLQPSTGGGSNSQPSYNYGNGYGNSYGNSYGNNYGNSYGNSYYNSAPRSTQQEESQVLSTRGYYVKDNQWNTVLLRVKVVGNNVYVVGIKRSSTGWSQQSTKASTTDHLQKEIKEVFDYYIGDYVYGRIYF